MVNFELDLDKSDYLLDLLDDVNADLQDDELEKILKLLREQFDAQ